MAKDEGGNLGPGWEKSLQKGSESELTSDSAEESLQEKADAKVDAIIRSERLAAVEAKVGSW